MQNKCKHPRDRRLVAGYHHLSLAAGILVVRSAPRRVVTLITMIMTIVIIRTMIGSALGMVDVVSVNCDREK